jgi:5-methylcytosine-specific restriction protein A
MRKAKLRADPICQMYGCARVATDVDHVIPLAEGGERYDWDNLASLCKQHHDEKTTRDARRGKQRPR